MDGTENQTPTSDSFLKRAEDWIEEVGQEVWDSVHTFESKFDKDVWPYVRTYLLTLASQTGQIALKAAIAAAPLLATGGFTAAGAVVGAAVVASLPVNAIVDAQLVLGQAQAALQVVKVANAVVTPSDAPQVAAITAATPQGGAPGA